MTFEELVERAESIINNGGDLHDVWVCLHEEYAGFGDPTEIHSMVADAVFSVVG